MRRGTTPTHIYTLPFDTSICEQIRVIYAYHDDQKLIKDTPDLLLDGASVKLTLTQEETLQFDNHELVEIQIRVKMIDGTVLASDIITERAERLLEDEVF